jgi:hypothetical protein
MLEKINFITNKNESKTVLVRLSVDIKSWDIQNLPIVSQTFELSLKIKIVIKELNFNLMFLTICHNFHNLICKKPNLHNVYF